jgi:hypothetical protein
MDVSTVVIAGGILIAVVVFFAFKNRKTAGKILQENRGVVPLMLQKSTQIKVTRLQQITKDNTKANDYLKRLVNSYKTNQINIQEYNEKLDRMIAKLEVEL